MMKTNPIELETTHIPLHKLIAWNGNVRITGADRNVDELAASIAHHGLLQSLVVKKETRGKFSVIAGRRRLLALSQLAEAGTIGRNHAVTCQVAPPTADGTEVSLAENVVREPMHPADEFEAFRKLIEGGQCMADIAARFGVSETVVQRRLALARVSPALLEKYRAGEMNLELLQAFTLTDDYARQEEIWQEIKPWNRNAAAIRQRLSEETLSATDKRVRFVDLAVYEAAGGRVKRDLFAEDGEGVYLLDADLLHRLVNEKLAALAEGVKAEGWKWVEVQTTADHGAVAQYRRLHAPEAPFTPEEAAHIEKLQTEAAGIEEQLPEDSEEEEEFEPLYARLEEIEEAIQSFQCHRKRAYSDQMKAHGGVIVRVGFQGEPELIYGLLRKEDERAFTSTGATPTEETPLPVSPPTAQERSPYSAPLLESLTTQKTAAIAAELTQQPNVALAAVVYTMVAQDFGLERYGGGATSSLQWSSRHPSLATVEDSPAGLFLAEQRQAWLTQLPCESGDLWRWCLKQEQQTLLRLLAFCASRSVNAIQSRTEYADPQRLAHANALGAALHMEMAKWFTPTADNFFSKISKSRMVGALAEAGTPLMVDTAQLKKAELAARAEKAIRSTGWLPEPLRIAPAGEPSDSDSEAEEAEQG